MLRHRLTKQFRLRRTAPRGGSLCRVVASLIVAALALTPAAARAQVGKRQTSRAAQAATKTKKAADKKEAEKKAQPKDELAALRDEFVRVTGEYKKGLGDLLPYQERDVRRAEEKLGKLQELKKEGLIAQRDVEAAEKILADARAKVLETEQQMKAADVQVANALVEEKVVEQAAKTPPPARGKMIRTTAYIRYGGVGSFSLSSGAGRVMSFYTQAFKKQLPISAFGQTAVHNQLGFDHRNAMDVALNPDSAEGRALVNYLRANGIPFFAFFMAIPGSATGPHIHVGMPSHKIR
ncbi:MAG: hypothetical protein LC774_00890 [Acidobacteria bacterium]|nr:hypothetical protein [Acidobacteriota bacterium]